MPQFGPQFASGQTAATPTRATAHGKQAAAGTIGQTVAASVQAPVQPVQKDASSAFNQLVAQILAESADRETAPAPAAPGAAAQTAKLPPKSTTASDQSSELPAPVLPSPALLIGTSTLSAAPAGGRRADTRGAAPLNPGNAQPASVPVDIDIPIPIAPKLQLPSSGGGGSPEQKPAAVSSTEERAAITLEPKPLLEVKIHLNQPAAAVDPGVAAIGAAATGAAAAAQPAVPASATRGVQDDTSGQQNPAGGQQNSQSGLPDPGDADTVPPPESNGHTAPRITSNQEAVVIAQQQIPAAGLIQPPAHDVTTAPVGAVPAAPAPEPMAAGDAKPEPQSSSAPLREEPLTDQTKTQQPLRSLALEFTPDGAGDIKVRLSERAGDVHISLHGTDPSLAGRVREGVGDLVGSLSNAGYDAEAWTSGRDRQNQRQEPEQRQSARGTSRETNAEEFSGILQQPIQEIS